MLDFLKFLYSFVINLSPSIANCINFLAPLSTFHILQCSTKAGQVSSSMYPASLSKLFITSECIIYAYYLRVFSDIASNYNRYNKSMNLYINICGQLLIIVWLLNRKTKLLLTFFIHFSNNKFFVIKFPIQICKLQFELQKMIKTVSLCFMALMAVYAGDNNVIIGDGNSINGNDNVQIGSQSKQIGNSNWISGDNKVVIGNHIQNIQPNTDPYFYRNSAYTPKFDKSFFDSFDPFNPPKGFNSKRWFGPKE